MRSAVEVVASSKPSLAIPSGEEFPFVTVVVVAYNSQRHLSRCLASLLKQRYPRLAVHLIDNASTDGTVAFIRSSFPSVSVHRNRENFGYAKGCNQGIRAGHNAGAEFICLLNPDAEADPDWLMELVEAYLSDDRAGIVQSKIYRRFPSSKILNSSGNREHYLCFGYCGGDGQREGTADEEIREIAFASGAGCLISREVIEKVGGFDEEYFMYHEDVDLCHRARLAGFKILYAPRAVARHDYTFEKGKQKYFLLERNRLRTFFKNYKMRTIALLFPIFLVSEVAVLFQSLSGGWFSSKLRSYLEFIRDLPELVKERRRVQGLRKVPDREIVGLFTSRVEQEALNGWGLRLMNRLWRGYWRMAEPWV